MIRIETENIEQMKGTLMLKKENKVYPGDVEEGSLIEYYQLKNDYKSVIFKLLAIRKGFTKKLIKDALPSLTTQQDDISEHEEEYDKYRVKKDKFTKRCIDLRRDYVPKLLIILILSFIFGFIISVVVYFSSYYDLIGWYLVCSKGCSLAILLVLSFLMFFISHDIMTFVRSR